MGDVEADVGRGAGRALDDVLAAPVGAGRAAVVGASACAVGVRLGVTDGEAELALGVAVAAGDVVESAVGTLTYCKGIASWLLEEVGDAGSCWAGGAAPIATTSTATPVMAATTAVVERMRVMRT